MDNIAALYGCTGPAAADTPLITPPALLTSTYVPWPYSRIDRAHVRVSAIDSTRCNRAGPFRMPDRSPPDTHTHNAVDNESRSESRQGLCTRHVKACAERVLSKGLACPEKDCITLSNWASCSRFLLNSASSLRMAHALSRTLAPFSGSCGTCQSCQIKTRTSTFSCVRRSRQ